MRDLEDVGDALNMRTHNEHARCNINTQLTNSSETPGVLNFPCLSHKIIPIIHGQSDLDWHFSTNISEPVSKHAPDHSAS